MKISWIFTICMIFSIISCKSGKLYKKGKDISGTTQENTNSEFKIEPLLYKQVKFKSDVEIKSKSISQGVPMTIHVEKDKQIWASVTLGLELARAKITKDSLVVLDRFNRRAYVGTWEELSKSANFELNFDILHSLLVGDLVFPVEPNDQISRNNNIVKIVQNRSGKVFESKYNNDEGKIFEILGKDSLSQSNLEITYKGFIQQNNYLVPTLISMILSGAESASLNVKHSKVEFIESGLSFSFSIPSSYKILKFPGI